jgi:hypothetical protein
VLTGLLAVFRNENGGRPQGVSLFLLNASLALLCSPAGFSIGHAENVVSLDTTVETAVAWNRVSKFLSLVLVVLNSVEDAKSVFV